VHTFGFSCGTVILALGLGFREEWDGLKIRSLCGNSGGLDGTVVPAKASRAKETAVWILNGELDTAHARFSRNVHEAFRSGGYDARFTEVWGVDHAFPLATVPEMLRWWRELDGERVGDHPAPPAGEEGYEVRMVAPGSAAAKARLAVGDRLLSADSKPLNTTEEVSQALCGRSRGDRVSLKVRRGKKEFKVTLEF
jgi:membrane-associated protease RseP (regulator of RpoE activity)